MLSLTASHTFDDFYRKILASLSTIRTPSRGFDLGRGVPRRDDFVPVSFNVPNVYIKYGGAHGSSRFSNCRSKTSD